MQVSKVFIAAALALLSACHETVSPSGIDYPPGTPPGIQADGNRLVAKAEGLPQPAVNQLQAVSSTPTTLANFLSNTTVRTYSFSHGSQIEHLTADGRTFLWYPGNGRPVQGRWETRQRGKRVQMCFMYGANTYNPVTREGGGSWECGPARVYLLGAEEIIAGDPLKLASGRLPFVLPRADVSVGDASKQVGRANDLTNKITW